MLVRKWLEKPGFTHVVELARSVAARVRAL